MRTLFALIAAALVAPAAAQLDPEALFERLSPSVWGIRTEDANNAGIATGSAVVVGNGLLVTNCHVLAKAKKVFITKDGQKQEATLESPDIERDLCTLRVAGLLAPKVAYAPTESLRVGMKVYALGNPRGLELTLSDGLLSGLRKNSNGQLEAVQTNASMSAGSSGGGLFDSQGRLIGVTNSGLRDSQNLNFAIPSYMIDQVPERAKLAVAARLAKLEAEKNLAQGVFPPGYTASAYDGKRPLLVGDRFEYRLSKPQTQSHQTQVLTVSAVSESAVEYNQGARKTTLDGAYISQTQFILGELDKLTPPQGWLPLGTQVGASWPLKHAAIDRSGSTHDLNARIVGESNTSVDGKSYKVIHIYYSGWRTVGGVVSYGNQLAYSATGYYSTDLKRMVRLTFDGGRLGNAYIEPEIITLIKIGRQ